MLRRLHLALSLALAAIFIVPAGAQVVVPTYSSTTGNTLNATGVVVLNSDGTVGGAAPSSGTDAAITPVVGSLVNGIVGKASAGNLYGGEITTAATAGYLYVFNSATVPTDGGDEPPVAWRGKYEVVTDQLDHDGDGHKGGGFGLNPKPRPEKVEKVEE